MVEGEQNTQNKNMSLEIKCGRIKTNTYDINFEYLSTPVVLEKSLEDINRFISETNNKYLK